MATIHTSTWEAVEPRFSGLLPVGVFLLLFIGSGVVLQDFYSIPAIVAFVCALAVAFIQNPKRSFDEKLESVARSMGDSNVMIMCLVFVLAGAFTGSVQSAGGVESTVNFALSILPTGIVLPGLFLIACFISISMGTSVGTIAALAPIACGVADKTDLAAALCLGAIVGGAMFGDNLSMISDTTIAATRTQGCEMDEKFKENFKIALPAAIITFIIFLALGLGSEYNLDGNLEYNLWQVLPYVAVLVAALAGVNVFLVLIGGTVLSIIVGVALGTIAPEMIFIAIGSGLDGGSGIMNMYDITVISIICAGIIGLVRDNGGIEWILQKITGLVHGKRGAQFGIAALASLVDVSTANNTVAITTRLPSSSQAPSRARSRTSTTSRHAAPPRSSTSSQAYGKASFPMAPKFSMPAPALLPSAWRSRRSKSSRFCSTRTCSPSALSSSLPYGATKKKRVRRTCPV